MPSLNDTGRRYWRSLDEVADTPEFREFMHHEFPAGAVEMLDSSQRRQFLKIMAASMAFAGVGMGGCRRWPKETIAPYANRPEGRVPGHPTHYATSMSLGGVSAGLLATEMDGRPVKIEGNPDHPGSRGGTSAFAQASVLGLYDPDRSRSVMKGGAPSTWDAFAGASRGAFSALRANAGTRLAVLSEASSSPTDLDTKRRFLRAYPQATWYEYEALPNDSRRLAAQATFGRELKPVYDFSAARCIVSLDADFLFDDPDATRHIRDFAAGRVLRGTDASMSRLYAFEGVLSLTGANADHRIAVRSADVAVIAAWLAARLLNDEAMRVVGSDSAVTLALGRPALEALEHALDDLRAAGSGAVVVAGPRQPSEVHVLAHLMNDALGAVGTTVSFVDDPDHGRHTGSITQLAASIDGGGVTTLLILGGNPVYDAPANLDFASRLAKVDLSIHLGVYCSETGNACTWHVNRAHDLEAWGDGRAADGTMSIVQPLIRPLFGGRTVAEVLAHLAEDDVTGSYDLVRRTFREMTGASDFEPAWRQTLHNGVLAGSTQTLQRPAARTEITAVTIDALVARRKDVPRDGLEIVFTTDHSVWDGRFGNNGWLQELPDPITKLTWDNAAIIGPGTAARLELETGDRVRISAGDAGVDAAAMVIPGVADDVVMLPLGYGRSGVAGRIAEGAGFDFYPLRPGTSMGYRGGASMQKTGGSYPLVTTQDHHAIDAASTGGAAIQDRLPTLVREGTVQEYREHPNFAKHRSHVVSRLSMWEEKNLDGANYAWGMSIDLNSCVGCNACVVACQAENNIPIVGKDQVGRGREMHWLRMDRYFKFGTDDHGHPDPMAFEGVALQPVACVHCENAPCEQVCPVAATVHDKDGLNVMVYNRCIGTRYCSNNCPYKVRRFNYFDYHRRDPSREQPGTLLAVKPQYYKRPQASSEPLEELQYNPEVSVRVRGVMEKCTYCTQRIQAAKIEAKNRWVNLPENDPRRRDPRVAIDDGAIRTACQQACPAEAISFGDLNDPDSAVSRDQRDLRTYEMLEEINVKPRTTYMAKLRNPAYGAKKAEAPHH